MSNLQNLHVLDLRHNRLTEIPAGVYKMSNVTTMYLRFNRIREVGEEIGNLTKLTNLSIRENNISKLPGSIGRLERLVTLDMSYNQLEHLPPELGYCRRLNSVVRQKFLLKIFFSEIKLQRILQNHYSQKLNKTKTLPSLQCQLNFASTWALHLPVKFSDLMVGNRYNSSTKIAPMLSHGTFELESFPLGPLVVYG